MFDKLIEKIFLNGIFKVTAKTKIPLLLSSASGIFGTAVMTLFSYNSRVIGIPEFKEIKLLNQLLSKNKSHILLASTIHFSVGILFALSYAKLWAENIGSPNLYNGIVLGSICGFISILVWNRVIKSSSNLPKVPLTHLAANLLPAHILFGLSATKLYKEI